VSKIKHSALSQKMGDVYHYYITINLFFKLEIWAKCSIEEQGDIVFFDENDKQVYNIEVKHHVEKNELKIYDEEFQKTLYNWFNIKDKFKTDTKLQLLTTSTIAEEHPLYHWNKYTFEKKYKVLLENQKKPDNSYYANVRKYFLKINKDPDELKKVLKKTEIIYSLPNIESIKKEIVKNRYFDIFNKYEQHSEVINSLYGLIASGLKDKSKWQITKQEFDQKIKELSSLAQDKILRTDNHIKLDEVDRDIQNYKEKQFIKKLINIDFEEDIFSMAVDDYARTVLEVSKRMDLSTSIEYESRLQEYDNSLVRRVNEIKTAYKYRSGNDIEKSQQSYSVVMGSNKIPFMPEEFDDQTTFFQKGYFHILADDEEKQKQICWSLKPEDLI